MTIDYVLIADCPDTTGIVAGVSGKLAECGCFVERSQHFGDPDSGRFFMRVVFRLPEGEGSVHGFRARFAPVADRFRMNWDVFDRAAPCRTLILVSKFGHCLNDLLFRWKHKHLNVDIRGIVSNHRDFEEVASWYGLPFHYLPVTKETKAAQEAALADLIDREKVELTVLARYMQILSNDLCAKLSGRAINIHHSFLPGFKGAKPYHQAHERGVKIIGATAHFVTADLDEGPIIEQDVERVDHAHTPDDMVDIGRDIESRVLARAVRAFAEHKVLMNGTRTVVFR